MALIDRDDEKALKDAIDHALEVADRECGTSCGDEHRQLARWLMELRTSREMPVRDGFLDLAFQYAADGDREGFDLIVGAMDERDAPVARALMEQTVFEELRQRALPEREHPFSGWCPEMRLLLERTMGSPGDDR